MRMQKKLMAIAVAGALAAPAIGAFAQTSTVNIYGSVRQEWSHIDEGGTRTRYERLENPGSSYWGLRGEEKLGRGLTAWFQVESTFPGDGGEFGNVGDAAAGGLPQGVGDRNTGVGLKGAFGNAFVGQWDTAYKQSAGGHWRPVDTTGITGVAAILHNETTTSDNISNTTSFYRRQSNSFHYQTPVWGGFQGMLTISDTQQMRGNGTVAAGETRFASTDPKARLWSLGGRYRSGPLAIGAGYERHNNYRGTPGTGFAFDDRAWNINAGYTFAGRFRLGGIWEELRYETTITGAEVKKQNWGIALGWNIAGPHNLNMVYIQAKDSKGNSATGVGGVGASLAGTTTDGTGLLVDRTDNGAKLWIIQYLYSFSKRTSMYGGYAKLDNDAAGRYRFHRTVRNTGQEMDAFAVGIRHSF